MIENQDVRIFDEAGNDRTEDCLIVLIMLKVSLRVIWV